MNFKSITLIAGFFSLAIACGGSDSGSTTKGSASSSSSSSSSNGQACSTSTVTVNGKTTTKRECNSGPNASSHTSINRGGTSQGGSPQGGIKIPPFPSKPSGEGVRSCSFESNKNGVITKSNKCPTNKPVATRRTHSDGYPDCRADAIDNHDGWGWQKKPGSQTEYESCHM